MSRVHARRHRPGSRDERGVALIIVMVMISVLSVLLAAVAQDAIASSYTSRHAQDWNAAMGAAEAGASDFLYRLNAQESSSYCLAQVVKTDAAGTGLCSAVTAVPPATAPGWVQEPGSTNSLLSCFQYSVPSTGLISASGTTAVLLDVVGKVTTAASCAGPARATRSIQVTLSRSTYLNYAYFTDLETQDPAQYSPTLSSEFAAVPNAQAFATQYCSNYYYALSNNNAGLLAQGTAPSGGVAPVLPTDVREYHSSLLSFTNYTANNICTYTKFSGGDTFNGPVHTNDVFSFNGSSSFGGPVTVSNPSNLVSGGCNTGYTANSSNSYGRGVFWVDANAAVSGGVTTSPVFSGGISCVPAIPLPTGNSSLLTEAESGGCHYVGITYLYFHATGSIDVYSPGTTAGSAGVNCPVNGTFTPTASFNGVIYVSNLGASVSCSLSTDQSPPATPGAFGSTLGQIVKANDLDELANEDNGVAVAKWGSAGVNPVAYDCHNGDAFVGGTMSGQLTVGADNNDVIYQNLTYADDTTGNIVNPNSTNVLGLEPQGSVQIYHPVSCPGWTTASVAPGGTFPPAYTTCNGSASTNMLSAPTSCPVDSACQINYVQAAVLCFNAEYTSENWADGASLGQLHTTGSVTQRYRGREAGTTDGSGYGKSYSYDVRLAAITPPYFLPANIFNWSQVSFAETTADSAH